ncbi:MAG: ATP-binding protein [Thermodesulfobacteriota bacterium]|nr:ATP-binding protein [Thermodesulfobacteriota bacterium]
MENDASALATLKPFRLVKFFSFTSLVVILISTLTLAIMISSRAKNVLLYRSEAYALVFAENLSHQISLRFLLPMDKRYGRISLRNPEQFEVLDSVVRNTIHGMKIYSVTIYGVKNNVVSYSTIEERIGKKDEGPEEYHLALGGENSSRLIADGSIVNLVPGAEPISCRVKTYVPMRLGKPFTRDTSFVVGVLEIEQDMSDDFESILQFQWTIITTSLFIMTALFVALRFLVARADRIIEARAEERRRLEKKLDQAERLASLGKMVASVSHEIKNPLGIVRSTAEILRKRLNKVAPGNDHLAGIIVEETGRLDGIVREFLDFARPSQPETKPVDVNKIVKKVVSFLEPELDRQGVTLESSLADVPVINADRDLLYRAFLNITMNSMQAMEVEGRLTVASYKGAKGKIVVEISDTGCGMAEETRLQVFQPFYTTKSRGTGLGLAIVKNILDTHQAGIEVESEEGVGTTFKMEFPAAD